MGNVKISQFTGTTSMSVGSYYTIIQDGINKIIDSEYVDKLIYLYDVSATTAVDGDILIYSGGTWKNVAGTTRPIIDYNSGSTLSVTANTDKIVSYTSNAYSMNIYVYTDVIGDRATELTLKLMCSGVTGTTITWNGISAGDWGNGNILSTYNSGTTYFVAILASKNGIELVNYLKKGS